MVECLPQIEEDIIRETKKPMPRYLAYLMDLLYKTTDVLKYVLIMHTKPEFMQSTIREVISNWTSQNQAIGYKYPFWCRRARGIVIHFWQVSHMDNYLTYSIPYVRTYIPYIRKPCMYAYICVYTNI